MPKIGARAFLDNLTIVEFDLAIRVVLCEP
jgi:hypothetical protein